MTDKAPETDAKQDGTLVSSLSVVEAQPLEERAQGYADVYEELRRRLESDDIAH